MAVSQSGRVCYSRLPALQDLSRNRVIAGDGGHMVE